MTVGLVIAKGESRRLPRKNMRDFCGKPLFAWSVIQLLNSRHCDETYVSTNDTEIADISRELGAHVLSREDPEALHPDAAANPVYTEMIRKLIAAGTLTEDDVTLHALPTSPVKLPWDYDGLYERHVQCGATQTVTICPERETMVYELLSDVRYKVIFADKQFRYATQGGAANAWNVGAYLEWNRWLKKRYYGALNDAEMDKVAFPGLLPDNFAWCPERGDFYYGLKPWQQWDIDDEESFHMCEIAMQAHILDKYGDDCYERYGRGE